MGAVAITWLLLREKRKVRKVAARADRVSPPVKQVQRGYGASERYSQPPSYHGEISL
jgi:hypothetical protein